MGCACQSMNRNRISICEEKLDSSSQLSSSGVELRYLERCSEPRFAHSSSCRAGGQALPGNSLARNHQVVRSDWMSASDSRHAYSILTKALSRANRLPARGIKSFWPLGCLAGAPSKQDGKNRNAALECFNTRGFHMDYLLGSSNVRGEMRVRATLAERHFRPRG